MRRRARRFGELAARAVPGGSGWASQHVSGTHFALIEVPSHVLTVSSQMWWWVLTDRARARARDHARLRACVHGWVVCLRLVEFESRRQAALVATGRAPPCVVLQFVDIGILMTAEEGLTMRNLQHASRFNAWLSQQCSQWTNTMLPALRQNGCPEHECLHCFFTHVQKMFNMPNLYRLSLEQLKGAKQTELVAGASYVLQFMQARVVTMQLADRTGRSQWEFVSQQACGDQLMRQMLPEYLRQFLLVAAADEYFRECTRTGFPFIMEDVPGHKTFLTLSETTDSVFAALDASTVGKESLPATVFKKPPEFLQRPPVVRSFDFPARRGARPTMVHTAPAVQDVQRPL